METPNSYADAARAAAYSRLEFPGTYYLAYRDLPELVGRHARGRDALDFGCGAGRSTRFLRTLGFAAVGVDIAPEMLERAHALDPEGDYRRIGPGGLEEFAAASFDLVLAAFTFDNVPALATKAALLAGLRRVLRPEGVLVNLVSSPEIYVHEWASFSTRDFPENRRARTGDRVRIVITAVDDARPVEDTVCEDADYRALYRDAGLALAAIHRPLGRADEPYAWVNETRIPPWTIYVLTPTEAAARPCGEAA